MVKPTAMRTEADTEGKVCVTTRLQALICEYTVFLAACGFDVLKCSRQVVPALRERRCIPQSPCAKL